MTHASSRSFIKTIVGLILGGVVSTSLAQAPESLDDLPLARFTQVGFELEMSDRSFAWLTPYFNFDHLEREFDRHGNRAMYLDARIAADYLLSPGAFDHLPESLKAELASDLDLQKKTQLLREEKKLLDSQGNAIDSSTKRGLILPSSSGLQRPAATGLRVESPQGLQTSPRAFDDLRTSSQQEIRSDWSLLNTRWNSLPLEKKTPVVRFSLLSARAKAQLVSKLTIVSKNPGAFHAQLPLKETAPKWIRRLVFSLDGQRGSGNRPVEAALNGPAESADNGFSIVEELLRETKTTQLLSRPHEQKRMDVAFHLHIGLKSDAPKAAEEALVPVLEAYRKLLAVRILAAGEHNDSILASSFGLEQMSQSTQNLFARDIGDKGLVRKVSWNHIEIRELTRSPRETYREFLSLLNLGAKEASRRISEEVISLIAADESIVRRISKNPAAALGFRQELDAEIVRQSIRNYIARTDANAQHPVAAWVKSFLESDPSRENFLFLLELSSPQARVSHVVKRELLRPETLLYFEGQAATKNFILEYFEQNPSIRALEFEPVLLRFSGHRKNNLIDRFATTQTTEQKIRILQLNIEIYSARGVQDNPDAQNEKRRWIQSLEKLYSGSAQKDVDWLLAESVLSEKRKGSLMTETERHRLIYKGLWTASPTSKITIEYLKRAGVLGQLTGYAFYTFQGLVSASTAEPQNLGNFLWKYGTSENDDKRLIRAALAATLRRFGLPPESVKANLLRASQNNPTEREAAAELIVEIEKEEVVQKKRRTCRDAL